MPDGDEDRRLTLTIESRVLKRSLGPTAWAVLEDVALDAVPRDGRWLATTSTRRLANHLSLTPGTVAGALARLCAEGIVHREDKRDARTGRFGESVYVVAPLAGLQPCVDSPRTARRDTDTPHMDGRDTVAPYTAAPRKEDRRTERAPDRRSSSPGQRRPVGSVQQLLLGDEPASTPPVPVNPSTPTTTKPQDPNPQDPKTKNPQPQDPYNNQTLNTTTERPTDSCQLFEQALPGTAAFRPEAGS